MPIVMAELLFALFVLLAGVHQIQSLLVGEAIEEVNKAIEAIAEISKHVNYVPINTDDDHSDNDHTRFSHTGYSYTSFRHTSNTSHTPSARDDMHRIDEDRTDYADRISKILLDFKSTLETKPDNRYDSDKEGTASVANIGSVLKIMNNMLEVAKHNMSDKTPAYHSAISNCYYLANFTNPKTYKHESHVQFAATFLEVIEIKLLQWNLTTEDIKICKELLEGAVTVYKTSRANNKDIVDTIAVDTKLGDNFTINPPLNARIVIIIRDQILGKQNATQAVTGLLKVSMEYNVRDAENALEFVAGLIKAAITCAKHPLDNSITTSRNAIPTIPLMEVVEEMWITAIKSKETSVRMTNIMFCHSIMTSIIRYSEGYSGPLTFSIQILEKATLHLKKSPSRPLADGVLKTTSEIFLKENPPGEHAELSSSIKANLQNLEIELQQMVHFGSLGTRIDSVITKIDNIVINIKQLRESVASEPSKNQYWWQTISQLFLYSMERLWEYILLS